MNRFSLTVFLGAFLLFELELIIAKKILPLYGGSFTVWTTCMLFFTTVMFLSYFFTDLIIKKMRIKSYGLIHLILLFLAMTTFPFNTNEGEGLLMPIKSILKTLSLTIGPAFFLLAMTNPLIQSWYHKSKGKDSHFLFSASNLGSLLGLLSYPLLLAPFFDLEQQLFIWYIAYGIFSISFYFCRPKVDVPHPLIKGPKLPGKMKIYWVLLSACSMTLLLAITNIITADIGSIPLLWIVPLIIYLVTFILNFKKNPYYPPSLRKSARMIVFSLALLLLILENKGTPLFFISLQYLILFFGCMFCHRKLYLSRPNIKQLTTFYLYLSLGGSLGSLCISVGVPLLGKHWGNTSLEYIVVLVLFGSSLLIGEFEKVKMIIREQKIVLGSFIIFFSFFLYFSTSFILKDQTPVLSFRNFYGPYRVIDSKGARAFYHGVTLHGKQFLDLERRKSPLMYFHPQSPIGEFFSTKEDIKNVGVLGMGIGSLTAYAKKGQNWDIFEIDPDVVKVAQNYFTHLKLGAVTPKILVGDGRLKIQTKPNNFYDLLIMDAFSSDSVPTHLITLEALKIYLGKLKEKGTLIFNISNRYLNLEKVLLSAAEKLKIPHITQLKNFYDNKLGNSHSSWFLMSKDKKLIRDLVVRKKWKSLKIKENSIRVWTDSYTNILAALKR